MDNGQQFGSGQGAVGPRPRCWWKAQRFLRLGVIVVAGVLIAMAMACGSNSALTKETGAGSNTKPASLLPTVSAGKQLYQQHCSTCHGAEGIRMPIAPLQSKEFLESRGDATLILVISEGKGAMPAWGKPRGGPLTDAQVQNVVAYLNYAASRESSSVKAGAGQQLYTESCARCHGDKGDRIPVAPLNVKGFLDSRSNDSLATTIADGRGQMPGNSKTKGGRLTDSQIQDTISYLRNVVETNVAAAAGRGRETYVASCLGCHGEKGDRVSGVALASLEFLTSRGDGKLIASIGEGASTMPGFGRAKGGSLDPSDIGAILAYLKAWSGTRASSALPLAGPAGEAKELYSRNCAPCHGETGDKVSGIQLRSKGFLQQKGDTLLKQTIARGNAKGMPAWGKESGGPFSDDQINGLVAYLSAAAADTGSSPSAGASASPSPSASGSAGSNASGTSGPSSSAAPAGGGAISADLIAKGKEVFTKNCTACHGETRDRIPTCKLTDKSWVEEKGDAGLTNSVTNGKGGMPAWAGKLSTDEIKAVVAFLKDAVGIKGGSGSTSSSSAPAGASVLSPEAVAKGKEVFAKNCTACHGETRDRIPTCKLADKDWVTQKGEAGLTNSVTNGKGGMPAWAGKLSNDEIKSVVSFLLDAVGAGGGSASGASFSAAPASGGAISADLVTKGKEVFTKNCTACHGDTRDRIPTCKLTDKSWVEEKGDAGLTNSVTNGKGGMPAWAGKLSTDEIKAVVAFLKDAVGAGGGGGGAGTAAGAASASPVAATSAIVEPTKIDTATGKALFTKNCQMCHGADGLQQKACPLGSKEWVQNTSAEGLRARITNGKPAAGMPTWGKSKGGSLSDDDISAIMLYIGTELAR
ncbi:MAG: c-type cytochrome [Chloroflexota bacterium]|nr:MAG: c-type cytochrome [Chloroflexota bacterium]